MDSKLYGVEEQRQRRKHIFELVYRNSAPFFDRDGNWSGAIKERGVRERIGIVSK
ncbi:hypothetical protein [Paenibacillus sp. GCM10027626]|uniref:hypothetical protein n=1 Tax=Paenibacillus sp. GCM10027626 TaxID=3273411 RepID=UPI003637DD13